MKSAIGMATIVGVLAFSATAFAGNSGTGAEYGTQPGFAIATSKTPTPCASAPAGAGAFGYFGKDNNLGIKSDPTDPGANGQQTGINNSSLCGNRQGNLP
jgi:hypothetical protein